MNKVKLFPGDTAIINGARVTVNHTVTLSTDVAIERIPTPGLTDMPDTGTRIEDIWNQRGRRSRMIFRHDLRCPCGSAYLRQSDTHISCQRCRRVWENSEVAVQSAAAECGLSQTVSGVEK